MTCRGFSRGLCGVALDLSRAKSLTKEQEHMKCSTCASEQTECTAHYIRTCVLKEILLKEINKMLGYVRENRDKFIGKAVEATSVLRKLFDRGLKLLYGCPPKARTPFLFPKLRYFVFVLPLFVWLIALSCPLLLVYRFVRPRRIAILFPALR